MNIKQKMKPAFQRVEGGLFSTVSKADVGDQYNALESRGTTMLGWADPFYPAPSTPSFVVEKAVDILRGGRASHYTMPIGNPELKEEIAKFWEKNTGRKLNAQRNIIITPGSDSGLLYAMMPFIGVGDEVMVPSPSYPSNFQNPELLGGVTVPIPTREENGYHLDIEEFKRRITSKSKMVLLTNPNNPTGTVYTEEELTALAQLIVENDLVCVCDQAFQETVFDGRQFVTMATLPGMWERTITVCSMSKGTGLSGFRVGYLVADDVIMDVLYGAAVNVLGATGTLQQQVCIEVFRNLGFVQDYIKAYDVRRKYAYKAFNAIPGVSMLMPEGTFMCWINVSQLGDSSEIVQELIERAGVACNDGKSYGPGGEGHLRVVIGSCGDNQTIFNAIDRMKEVFLSRSRQ